MHVAGCDQRQSQMGAGERAGYIPEKDAACVSLENHTGGANNTRPFDYLYFITDQTALQARKTLELQGSKSAGKSY